MVTGVRRPQYADSALLLRPVLGPVVLCIFKLYKDRADSVNGIAKADAIVGSSSNCS